MADIRHGDMVPAQQHAVQVCVSFTGRVRIRYPSTGANNVKEWIGKLERATRDIVPVGISFIFIISL